MSQDEQIHYLSQKEVGPQLVGSDVILMVPGRFRGVEKDGKKINRFAEAYKGVNKDYPSENGDIYIECIEDSVEEEIAPGFRFERISKVLYEKQKDLYDEAKVEKIDDAEGNYARNYRVPKFERVNLGKIDIVVVPDEEIRGREPLNVIIDNAFLVMLFHIRSRCCVFEIYIPECKDTVHILEAYRHGRLLLRFPDGTDTFKDLVGEKVANSTAEIDRIKEAEHFMELDEFFEMLSITPLAIRRSAVFAYGKHDEQEYINCLANEEAPKDGDVSGRFAEKIKSENRAQYKCSRTYTSTVTLLEVVEDCHPKLKDRIAYQTTEIFFIEMLLIRDASTDDIMQKLYNVSELISEDLISGAEARKELEKIHQNLSNAITFTGTTQYLWPTVQESVKLLSKDFDLDDIERRYKEAENVIEDKIDALVRKDEQEARESEEKNESVKNAFLFVIALCGWITAVKECIDLFTDVTTTTAIAVVSVVVAIAIYYAVYLVRKKKGKSKP